jgi:hypothetical protein
VRTLGFPARATPRAAGSHIFTDRQRVEQRIVLEQHADVGAQLQQIALGHVVDPLAVHENPARVRAQQSKNQLEHHGLPGSAGAQQDGHRAFCHLETELAQHDVIVEGQ